MQTTERLRDRLTRNLALLVAGGALCLRTLAGCAPPPPPPAPPGPPPPPLERICQEALPLRDHTIGALAQQVRALNPRAVWSRQPCDATTAWPISFAEAGADRPPIGVALLRMEGDALLSFDARDRAAPSVKLCAELRVSIDERHRLFAVALWPSDDEGAFDPAHLEAARAELGFLELRSRGPSDCLLGKREEDGVVPDPELRRAIHCAPQNLASSLPDDPACLAPSPAVPAANPPEAEVARAFARTHRFVFAGRTSARDPELSMVAPETCGYEPPPATHDVCVSVYRPTTGDPAERWYARSDVTRTGVGGAKNYVDSYLTLQLLRRLEAERRRQNPKAPAKPTPAAKP